MLWLLLDQSSFNAEAKFVEESPSDLKAHIVIGGDTGGRYYANPDGSFPGALYDHSFVIPKAGTAKISIDLDEAGITPDEFMNNPLIFFIMASAFRTINIIIIYFFHNNM